VIISPDSYLFTEDGTYLWSVPRVKAAWNSARTEFQRVLSWPVKPSKVVLLMGMPASGKSTWLAEHEDETVLYFDACLDLPWKREPFIKQARAMGISVEVVWFCTPLEVCIERNAARSPDRQVPADVIRAMARKIASSPPTEGEGFALIRWEG